MRVSCAVRRRLLQAMAAGALVAGTGGVRAQDPRATVVVAAARDWLLMTDHNDAAESYKRASLKFRGTMSEKQWQAALTRERAPRGSVVQRTLVETTFRREMAGVPAGEYAVLQFRTTFAKQGNGAELMTLEREADGVWRVVGYLIR